MTLRIAVDVGGTFTDGVLLDETTGRIWLAKSLTTYADPGNAIATVSRHLLEQHGKASDVDQVVHGTTLITNSLIERKGVKTALVTNTGMRDALDIRRELRYDTYDLGLTYPQPLVALKDRHEVGCRLGPDGVEWAPLDEREVVEVAQRMRADAVEAIAVCLLHSPVSPRHEESVREALGRLLPGVPVSISSEVSGAIGEYERMSTTVANAFVQPLVKTYLARLSSRFVEAGIEGRLDIMVSNGAFTTAAQAGEFPIRLLESGPAGGVLSAINAGMLKNAGKVLAFDMGGTTAKSAVAIDGKPEVTQSFEFAREKRFKKGSGLPAQTPSIDLIEIGAGGGSIARISPLGLLQVGPESAGSEPGPACYGLGGEAPTVTDADLVLGHLDADGFLGGTMKLQTARPSRRWNGSERSWAWTLWRRRGASTRSSTRTWQRRHEPTSPRRGSTYASSPLSRRAGPAPSTPSTWPAVCASAGFCVRSRRGSDRASVSWSRRPGRTAHGRASKASRTSTAKPCRAGWPRQEPRLWHEITGTGIDESAIEWNFLVEMRYLGQGASVEVVLDPETVPSTDVLTRRFLEEYAAVFGRTVPGSIPEVVTWRIWGIAGNSVRRFTLGSAGNADTPRRRRDLYVPAEGRLVEVDVYPRETLSPGERFRSPCIVTEKESTLVVSHMGEVIVGDDGTIEVLLDEVVA